MENISLYYLDTKCITDTKNVSTISEEELQQKLKDIETTLTVGRRNTSAYKRQKISAPDERVSSTVLGFTCGVVILCSVLSLLVFSDIALLYKYLTSLYKRKCKKK